MSITIANDATHGGISALPKGQLAAGYTTGSGTVPWTAADWASHPGAVRIDQSPDGHDPTADVYDVESQAGTPARSPGWAKAALASYRAGTRPGQRSPAIYVNLSNVSTVVNALVAGGVTSGVGLWLANWNNNLPADAAQIASASGPFPVIGIQFHNAGSYDTSAFSTVWLDAVSGPVNAYPVLALNASGPAVTTAQTRLNVWGASPVLTADGSFGVVTQAAVKAFQTAQKLTVDGTIGAATWAALNKSPVPVPTPVPVPATFAVATLPPGTWQAGTPLILAGLATDGTAWRTTSPDGKTWTAPARV